MGGKSPKRGGTRGGGPVGCISEGWGVGEGWGGGGGGQKIKIERVCFSERRVLTSQCFSGSKRSSKGAVD